MSGASTVTLSVPIVAVDRITAPLRRVAATALRLQGNFGHLQTRLRGLTQFDRIAAGARSVASSMALIVPPLGALTAAGTLAGVVALANRWSNFATQLSTTAYRVQTTASQLNALQNAGRLAGVSAEQVTQGLEGLGDAMSDAVGGRDSGALQYFQLLGVRFRDAAGNARTAAEALPDVADGISRISDPRLQARVLSALRLPASLLPFLKEGSAGLRRWEQDARRFGVITEQGAAIGVKFAQTQERLKMAADGLVNSIAQRLAPVIGPMLERLTEWIAANRDLISQRLEEFIGRIARAIESFVANGGLEDLIRRTQDFGAGIQRVVDWMGGWENAAIGLGAVLAANMVAPLLSIVGSLTAIAAFRVPAWMARQMAGRGSLPAPAAPASAAPPVVAPAGGGAAAALGPAATLAAGWYGEDWLKKLFGVDEEAYQRSREEGLERGWEQLSGWFTALVRKLADQTTPGGGATSTAQRRFGGRAALAPGSIPDFSGQPSGDRLQQAFDYFVSQGWTPEQAAGLVANLRHESGAKLDHRAVGDNGRARGIAQWHPDRQENFRQAFGKDIGDSSFEEQLAFVQHELTRGAERAAGEALRRAQTAAEAGSVVSRRYERPARTIPEAASRARTADVLLPQLRAPAPAPAAVKPEPASPAQPQPAAGQKVDVNVRLSGLPAGVTATTTTRNSDGGVRIERTTPGSNLP